MLVVKLGGSLTAFDSLLDELSVLDQPLVIVHGAHRELDEISTRLSHPPRMVRSVRGETSRFTDSTTMDLMLMAYCGKANKRLVEALRARGANAVGLSAMDGGIAVGRRKPDLRYQEAGRTRVLHGDHAGSIDRIDTVLLGILLEAGFLPVLTPPAISHDGVAINVDGDRLAMELACALNAERLIIFADTPGFLADPDDQASVIPAIKADEVAEVVASARGRARIKVLSAAEAVRRGVAAVGLVDGRGPRPLSAALGGAGTWVTR